MGGRPRPSILGFSGFSNFILGALGCNGWQRDRKTGGCGVAERGCTRACCAAAGCGAPGVSTEQCLSVRTMLGWDHRPEARASVVAHAAVAVALLFPPSGWQICVGAAALSPVPCRVPVTGFRCSSGCGCDRVWSPRVGHGRSTQCHQTLQALTGLGLRKTELPRWQILLFLPPSAFQGVKT